MKEYIEPKEENVEWVEDGDEIFEIARNLRNGLIHILRFDVSLCIVP